MPQLLGDFPDVIEEYLEHGIMKCVAFNRRGTLLAAGCADGSCFIWDLETRGISRELRDEDCSAAITSISWSKYGHRILVSASDKSLILWDVLSGEKIGHVTLEQTVLQARLHPGSSTHSLCGACPVSSAPMVVDLISGSSLVLPVLSDVCNGTALPSRRTSNVSTTYSPSTACFNKNGDLVYAGNSRGEILIIDHRKVEGRAIRPNTNDRTIRVYKNLLPVEDGLKKLDEISETLEEPDDAEKLMAVGARCLLFWQEFQDSVNGVQWKSPCFSGDSEWVIGGSASRGEHKIHIWDRAGHLVKILEGPNEALMDLAWHPVNPVIFSVSANGLVYIWAKDHIENWSAFAPDFKELEENEEYVEREDEFDLMAEKVKDPNIKEDDEVDIVAVEEDSGFSDSDMSQEELCFLPAIPCPAVPHELQDECVSSSSKLPEGSQPESPPSVEAEQNGHIADHASSPVEVMYNSIAGHTKGTRLKRKRKPLEKALELELQAEKMKKPLETVW